MRAVLPAGDVGERPRLQLVPRRARRRGVPVAHVQLAMIFAGLAVLPLVKVVDNDFWWHLRTGQLVINSGIPRHDPFSWSRGGAPWTAHEWLSEAIIYAVQSVLGYAGNVVLFAAATVAALWLMYRLGRSLGAGTRPLVALTLLAACVMGLFVTVRPQVFTWLLFATFVALIERHDSVGGRRIWLLPALMAGWANLHLGFFFGFLVLGCWIAARAYERLQRQRGDLRTSLVVSGACIIAAAANPSGPAILWYPARYLTDASVTHAYVQEWQPPNVGDPFHAAIFVTAAVLVATALSRTRPRPFLLLLAVLTAGLSMQALRNAPFAALIVVPVAAAAAAKRWPSARASADSNVRTPLPLAMGLPVLTAAIIGSVAVAFGGAFSLWSPSHHSYPSQAVAYVRTHDAGKRVLNDYSAGGFEIAQWYPETRVFVDGRTDFYGDAFLKDYITLIGVGPGWRTILARYAPDVVLLPPSAPLIGELRKDPAWTQAFAGEGVVVLDRR
jgi:hypothetical protein